jgi:soluble lytic murein transglycosylase
LEQRIKRLSRPGTAWLAGMAIVVAAVGGAVAAPGTGKTVPIPRPRPAGSADAAPRAVPVAVRSTVRLAPAPTSTTSAADLAAVKRAIERIRHGGVDDATEIEKTIEDPVARKVVEWALLRSDDNGIDFNRYVAFLEANPSWPSIGMLRRRAEAQLWQEARNPATVRGFFATTKPLTPKGRFALARALLAQGDRNGALHSIREAWRGDAFSGDLESQVIETFPDMIGAADHKARMDRRLYVNDHETALRAAHRLGSTEMAIAKARIAVNSKAGNALALLDAVPAEARRDAGYMFSRIQWLRRHDQIEEAARLMLAAPRDPAALHDLDEWWVERRLIARKLLDEDDPRTAYQVARDAAPPVKENYRGEHQFTAGWIALRFLNDPSTALVHFAKIAEGITNPITLARSEYWQARSLEAMGRQQEARAHYEAAGRFPTAYYGQIARAKLGHGEIALRRLPDRAEGMNLEVVRAVDILYSVGEKDLVVPFVADLAERASEPGALAMIGEITARHSDARAMLLLGKTALQRGYALDHYAFPSVGVPNFSAVGPEVDRSVIYSIVRQESAFNPRDVSTANALGLMQVTPEAGRYVAKKFGVEFNQKRLMSDIVYNTQMGAAELGDLLQDYRGSYILAFAGYNAGRGRVREWVQRYGDPRDPNVDPIDWVERIPFSETRNYVQRVLENLQVYRVRLGHGSRLLIEADLRRGSGNQ